MSRTRDPYRTERDSQSGDSSFPAGQGDSERVRIPDLKEIADGIRSGDRTSLARGITITESSRPEHHDFGIRLLEMCLPLTGNSVRIAVTGIPGVGKSTFIEAIGTELLQQNRKVAVLAVDPSSSRSKGSILGDKTRMQNLSMSEKAFIRPSPTSGTLGGVTLATRESMLLCEAAGFDTILIETTGVGQSETAVHSMTDILLLLMLPGAGDELQGMKRGIMEMADLIAINKAEDPNLSSALRARQEYEHALSLYPPPPSGRRAPVLLCSAAEQSGIREILDEIDSMTRELKSSGAFSKRRREQDVHWMHELIRREITSRFYRNPEIAARVRAGEEKVRSGEMSSYMAAAELISHFDTM